MVGQQRHHSLGASRKYSRRVTLCHKPHPPPLQLKAALEAILAQPGAVRPERVKFFRGQMQTIISRALGDLGLPAVPTRRCFTLIGAQGAG